VTVELPIAGPSNRFLMPQRDRRWLGALAVLLAVATTVVLVLFLIGWPRLKSTSIHYELIGLRAQVQELERRERGLRLELERRRSPVRLRQEGHRIGLAPPTADSVAAPDGAP
jgi:hypothetical protein